MGRCGVPAARLLAVLAMALLAAQPCACAALPSVPAGGAHMRAGDADGGDEDLVDLSGETGGLPIGVVRILLSAMFIAATSWLLWSGGISVEEVEMEMEAFHGKRPWWNVKKVIQQRRQTKATGGGGASPSPLVTPPSPAAAMVFADGDEVLALYEGEYYHAVVQRVVDGGVHVLYTGYDDERVVLPEHVRPTDSAPEWEGAEVETTGDVDGDDDPEDTDTGTGTGTSTGAGAGDVEAPVVGRRGTLARGASRRWTTLRDSFRSPSVDELRRVAGGQRSEPLISEDGGSILVRKLTFPQRVLFTVHKVWEQWQFAILTALPVALLLSLMFPYYRWLNQKGYTAGFDTFFENTDVFWLDRFVLCMLWAVFCGWPMILMFIFGHTRAVERGNVAELGATCVKLGGFGTALTTLSILLPAVLEQSSETFREEWFTGRVEDVSTLLAVFVYFLVVKRVGARFVDKPGRVLLASSTAVLILGAIWKLALLPAFFGGDTQAKTLIRLIPLPINNLVLSTLDMWCLRTSFTSVSMVPSGSILALLSSASFGFVARFLLFFINEPAAVALAATLAGVIELLLSISYIPRQRFLYRRNHTREETAEYIRNEFVVRGEVKRTLMLIEVMTLVLGPVAAWGVKYSFGEEVNASDIVVGAVIQIVVEFATDVATVQGDIENNVPIFCRPSMKREKTLLAILLLYVWHIALIGVVLILDAFRDFNA